MSNAEEPQIKSTIPATLEPRLVLIDTNCFLRLYHSPVRPFMGEVIGNYKLMTLQSLIDEFYQSKRLQEIYAWATADIKAEDVGKIALQLTQQEESEVRQEYDLHEVYVQDVIQRHCLAQNTTVRSLSKRDLNLLATSIAKSAIIATDEWPLRLAIEDLISEEDEYEIAVISSLDILHLLEENKRLKPEERRETIISWIRYDEKLPRGWKRHYKQLFSESAPEL